MRRKAHQRHAQRVGPCLERLQRAVRFVVHLVVEDLDTVEAHLGGDVDALEHARALAVVAAERIGRHADRIAIV